LRAAAARIDDRLQQAADERQSHRHSGEGPREVDVFERASDRGDAFLVRCAITRGVGDAPEIASRMILRGDECQADWLA
jgi:hypothetical protein